MLKKLFAATLLVTAIAFAPIAAFADPVVVIDHHHHHHHHHHHIVVIHH
jgi:hypothetical protein